MPEDTAAKKTPKHPDPFMDFQQEQLVQKNRPSAVNGWLQQVQNNNSFPDIRSNSSVTTSDDSSRANPQNLSDEKKHSSAPQIRIEPPVKPRSPALSHLLANNRAWAARMTEINPDFFSTLSRQQSPKILWIGCSDSRVPANQIVDLAPGEVFVHRNIANVFVNTDFNALSVLQYAVDVLKVHHVIVCGHYGCGGVAAAASSKQYGLIDNWLRAIKDQIALNQGHLTAILNEAQSPSGGDGSLDPKQKTLDFLCEMNVARSLHNVCHTTIVQNAWARGQTLSVHGWCYRLTDGLIRDLDLCIRNPSEIESKIHVFTEKVQSA